MIPKPTNIILRFCPDVIQKLLITGIHAASKHELLPQKNSHLIAHFVELVSFINAATPNTKHIHVCLSRRLNKPAIFFASHTRRKTIGRDPVRAFCKNRNAVNYESEASTPGIIQLSYFERTQTR